MLVEDLSEDWLLYGSQLVSPFQKMRHDHEATLIIYQHKNKVISPGPLPLFSIHYSSD